jgi:hypothetical protein
VTVREWFRQDRAAMWREARHPAHGIAREIDRLANAISDTTNVPDGYSAVADVEVRFSATAEISTLWLPAGMIRENGQRVAAQALEEILQMAWPVADREKYDWTYNMLTRGTAGPRVNCRFFGIGT